MTYKTILLDVKDGVARLTFNRPDKMNALSLEALGEVQHAIRAVGNMKAEARVLVLSGAGRGFSAGLDLVAPRPNPSDRDEAMRDFFVPAARLLKDIGIPTLAVVHGPCVGAGMAFALNCDIVLAARSAYFLAAFVNVGLVPDTGASWSIPQSLGVARAMGMLLLGERVAAPKAEEWGLIWKCVDDDQLAAEADAMARKLAAGPSKAYDLIRRMVMDSVHGSFHDGLQREAEYQRLVRDSEDAIEARKAFAEKRPPQFKGK
ncbi:MAG TPA: enoyl-CoA hydratase-related protein [Burkholderiales bacterium]|nr:enoyl-CoA hydratase-related protein [Burkholderiales bacterium]